MCYQPYPGENGLTAVGRWWHLSPASGWGWNVLQNPTFGLWRLQFLFQLSLSNCLLTRLLETDRQWREVEGWFCVVRFGGGHRCVCFAVCSGEIGDWRICRAMWVSQGQGAHMWGVVCEVPEEREVGRGGGVTWESCAEPVEKNNKEHTTHWPSPGSPQSLALLLWAQ